MTSHRTAPETCPYCAVSVDDEPSYRRHLHDAHDPSNLGAIDRRRYEQYRTRPNALVEAGTSAKDRLTALRYPVARETAVQYVWYGFAASCVVGAVLGVGL